MKSNPNRSDLSNNIFMYSNNHSLLEKRVSFLLKQKDFLQIYYQTIEIPAKDLLLKSYLSLDRYLT